IDAAELCLLLTGYRLDPTEGFLDPLANALARRVAAMPGRPPVDRRASITGVLRYMRRHLHRSQLVDEVGAVEALVTTERDRPRPVGVRLDHVKRRHPLGMPIRLGQASVDQKTGAVLHQAMADEAEPGLLARTLPVEPGCRIG